MKKSVTCSFMTLFFFFFAFASFAKNPKCHIRQWSQSIEDAMIVPVIVEPGAIMKSNHLLFDGIKVSATFYKGDSLDPGTYFQMNMDDVSSTLYDVTENTRLPTIVKADKIIFHCWFE